MSMVRWLLDHGPVVVCGHGVVRCVGEQELPSDKERCRRPEIVNTSIETSGYDFPGEVLGMCGGVFTQDQLSSVPVII